MNVECTFKPDTFARTVTVKVVSPHDDSASTVDDWTGKPDTLTLARFARLVVGRFATRPRYCPPGLLDWLDGDAFEAVDVAAAQTLASRTAEDFRQRTYQIWSGRIGASSPHEAQMQRAFVAATRGWFHAHRSLDPGPVERKIVKDATGDVIHLVSPKSLRAEVASGLILPLLWEQRGREIGTVNARAELCRNLRWVGLFAEAELVMPPSMRSGNGAARDLEVRS